MARGNFGERLKRERELREVSLDELTKATRISTRFLNALENEDWERLPGGVFGHGFVRTIARYLGLDEEALLAEYDLARTEKFPPHQTRQEERIPSPPRWVPAFVVLVLLVFLLGLFYLGRYGWHRYAAYRAGQNPSGQSASTLAHPPGSKTPATSGASLSPGTDPTSPALDLSVSTSAATRVRVLGDGKLLLDAEMPAGETRHFFSEQQFEVFAGDSLNVVLEMNGVAMPPVGTPGLPGSKVYGKKDLRQGADGNTQP
jgi:cytoskeletal protein RodZ